MGRLHGPPACRTSISSITTTSGSVRPRNASSISCRWVVIDSAFGYVALVSHVISPQDWDSAHNPGGRTPLRYRGGQGTQTRVLGHSTIMKTDGLRISRSTIPRHSW
jgi:hypothetical protein